MDVSAKSFFLLASGASRNSFMKKTETKNSRATVPLRCRVYTSAFLLHGPCHLVFLGELYFPVKELSANRCGLYHQHRVKICYVSGGYFDCLPLLPHLSPCSISSLLFFCRQVPALSCQGFLSCVNSCHWTEHQHSQVIRTMSKFITCSATRTTAQRICNS